MAHRMSDDERRAFLSAGTRTGHLATTRDDGRPHVAPVWFVLDGDDLVFMTSATSVKGRNLAATGRAAVSVDDARPPYSFVMVEGTVTLSDDLDEMWPWALAISERYTDDAEGYARRNAVEGEVLVRLRPTNTVARGRVAD